MDRELKNKLGDRPRILIVKISASGDILQAFSVLGYLRKCFPQGRIDWVIDYRLASLAKGHPQINGVLEIDKNRFSSFWSIRNYSYEVLFDLQGNSKTGFITLLAKSRYKVGFGYKTVREWPNLLATRYRWNPSSSLNIRHQYLYLVRSFFQDPYDPPSQEVSFLLTAEEEKQLNTLLPTFPKDRDLFLISPWSKWSNKQLSFSTLEKWLQIISEKYALFFVFLWGDLTERSFSLKLHQQLLSSSLLLPKASLPLLQKLLFHFQGVIAADSAPLHLAGTTTIPCFSFFGPTSAKVFSPLGKSQGVIQGSCPYHVSFQKQCPYLRSCKTGACLKEISLASLIDAFCIWWEKINSSYTTVCFSKPKEI